MTKNHSLDLIPSPESSSREAQGHSCKAGFLSQDSCPCLMAVGMISNSTATVVANSSTGGSKPWCSKRHSWTQPEAHTLLTLPRGFRHSPFHVFNPFPFKIPSYFPFLEQKLADTFSFALQLPRASNPLLNMLREDTVPSKQRYLFYHQGLRLGLGTCSIYHFGSVISMKLSAPIFHK